jgi:3-oxoacyl-[acyl-carrier protein] reductase
MIKGILMSLPEAPVDESEDMADAALWLAGPAFATGLNLQINGGMFLFRFPTPAEVGGAKAYEKRPHACSMLT